MTDTEHDPEHVDPPTDEPAEAPSPVVERHSNPSNAVTCDECTTPYPLDLPQCPNCGLVNEQRAAHLAGGTPGITETERARLAGDAVRQAAPVVRAAENNTAENTGPRATVKRADRKTGGE